MTYLKSMDVNSPLTAFGEVLMAENTANIQAHAAYDVLPANFQTFTATGGSATLSNHEFVCQTGTSVGGYGVIRSRRAVLYRAGEAALARFTGRFTTGVANSIQLAGLFNIGDGFFFGYDGADFGVCHRYGGQPECRTITVTLAASGATDLTLTLNSVAYTIPLTVTTAAGNAREIANWLTANQSVWKASQNGSTVVVISQTDGALSGTYSYSHATSTGTITQTRAGVAKQEDWTYLSGSPQWSNPPAWAFDPTKGNVYSVAYQYLGYGNIFFSIENPTTGRYELVHMIRYTNANTSTSVGNPNMKIGIAAASLGSTTNLTTVAASFGAFVQGKRVFTRNPRGSSNTISGTTTLAPVITLRSRVEFNGYSNQGEIQPQLVSLANTSSTRNAVFEIYNASDSSILTGYNFSYVNQSNLISEIDIASTAINTTSAVPIAQFVVAPLGNLVIDLTPYIIKLPSEIFFTIAARTVSGTADLSASIMWYEEVF